MTSSQVWQSETVAKTFLEGVRGAIPLAAAQIDVMLRLITIARPQLTNFLDLGCGDGILGRAILTKYPQAEGIFLDFSVPMLQAAQDQLDNYPQLSFVNADLGDPSWPQACATSAPFDAIVSGFAIHHQPDHIKKTIYQQIFQLLKPGGIFLNIEHVSSPSPWISQVWDELFIDNLTQLERQKGTDKSRQQIAQDYYYRPDKAANILAPVELQINWLQDIGFINSDCYLKIFEIALFGGIKP
ncbi:MAG TPA: class I SAM-dependent methyltransferase [Oscillatoriaceae cyanobacterium M33_DOE_052]|uniref:Class I SAM-dependent methyltransferase n=1 Tax=Planktothricoides sp. SpSt-374 TaxID=2282167 RepID=A0A7C3ZYV7_9CYAN|nr:class I SAM-dependent methyltransferase [Oscillatoriaceae cyanobacterium M33_DOE_052]